MEAEALLESPSSDLSSVQGWTNYNHCFLPEIRDLMKQLEAGTRQETERKMWVAHVTRVLELTGLTVSLVSLMASLFIFTYFRLRNLAYSFNHFTYSQPTISRRSLQNHRTRIHKNLFLAIGIQVIIRMTLYMDQAVSTPAGKAAGVISASSLEGSSVDQLQSSNGIHTTVKIQFKYEPFPLFR